MFKAIFGGFRKAFLPKVHLKGLLGTDQLKDTTVAVTEIARNTFTRGEPKRQETFAEAIQRLQLTPDALAMRHQRFIQLAYSFLGMAFLCFAYSVYLAFQGEVLAFILGVAVSVLGLVYAFRYHFLAFQLKHQKLGCSLKEWWNGAIDSAETTAVVIQKHDKQ